MHTLSVNIPPPPVCVNNNRFSICYLSLLKHLIKHCSWNFTSVLIGGTSCFSTRFQSQTDRHSATCPFCIS